MVAASAAADPPRFHASAAAARAVTGHQQRELGFGAAGILALEAPISSILGLQAEAGSLWLSEGAEPEDPKIAPGGTASSLHGAVGARLRASAEAGGPWLLAAGGMARTGELWRPMSRVAIGYDFVPGSGTVGLGPMLGLYHVFQPDTAFRPADANVVLAGLHAVFGASGRERPVRAPAPRAAEPPTPDEPVDRDRDGDGILDPHDLCPDDPEDMDGFEDEDGCPDLDNDQDGIPDIEDLCPNEPETKNGFADEDGCPDAEQVRVVGDKIVLDDRVHFATNSAQIRALSHPLLERVAALILENPNYVQIQVEGHTDERGGEAFNEKLSRERAQSVIELLAARGVERSRLSARGHGSSQPLVDTRSERAWYMNRRVEFTITRARSSER
jgi:outer membrane protein OmpA-like peptidoglycan-associated protein